MSQPLLEGPPLSALSTTIVFQQKLFGHGFSQFRSTAMESIVVVGISPSLVLNIPNCSTLDTSVTDVDVAPFCSSLDAPLKIPSVNGIFFTYLISFIHRYILTYLYNVNEKMLVCCCDSIFWERGCNAYACCFAPIPPTSFCCDYYTLEP